ncbi:hypothetical protein P3T76_003997 [Phytophthora citrophthora]|uniref:Uncharacterized protein n=1 Tax=Phytophthora citrophthora TaxID=4793 RepID=A0AAD9GT51_9STRA|nr:hypothetical protein P3T76_003997 [Phytophthora citrophthora]
MGRKRKKEDNDAVAVELSPFPTPSQEPSPTYRLKQSTTKIHSSVICKLSRVCLLPGLVEEIKRVCVVMKQVQLEGWHLANLHVLRCLKEKDDVPGLEQMLFYRCCAATLKNMEQRDRPKAVTKYTAFHKTCQRYWAGREQVTSYQAEFTSNGSRMINELAKLMSINALNMVAPHFRRRLHQYIRFKYAEEGKLELPYKQTKKLVNSCYRVKSVPEDDDDGLPTGKMVKQWTQWDETSDPVEKELRAWLGIVPWQWQVRANSAHFLHKLYDMLTFMEKFAAKHPKTKGARVYSLLPVSTSYQAAYVKINATTLFSLFTRLIRDPKLKEFMSTELPEVDRLPFSLQTFQKHRSEILRKVFDVDQFETWNRKFAEELKTNGYGVSITMIRPVTTTSVVVKERDPRKKRKKNDGTTAPTSSTTPKKRKVKTPEEIAEKDTFGKELFKLGPNYSPDVLIGIDPGMRSLVTAVSVGHLSTRRRHHPIRRRQHRARARQKERKQQERIVAISTHAYRHLARMNDFRLSYEKLKKREPWYAALVRAMPSFKTANYDLYWDRLHFFWLHVRFLLAFSAEQAFLQWRFTQDRAKMAALTTLATRIVPKPSKRVCIAYGDWSRRDGIRGHPTGPVKGFVEALKMRAMVIPMDEYRTSLTCSCCHKRLKQTRLFNNVKRKDDEADVRAKDNPSPKELKEIAEMSKFRNPKLASRKIVLRCSRNVLRCTNRCCTVNFWNRDVNAARNMLELLLSRLKGKHGTRRLRAFRRGK